jgi:hypothetical protein
LVQKSSCGLLEVPQFWQIFFWPGAATATGALPPTEGRPATWACIRLLTAAAVAPANTAPQLSQNSSVALIFALHTGHFIKKPLYHLVYRAKENRP